MHLPEVGGEEGVDDEVEAVLGDAEEVEDTEHHLLEVGPEAVGGEDQGERVEETVRQTRESKTDDLDRDDLDSLLF